MIAIIAILAAILFPVFAQAREKARQASCISNNKQVGLAILQYTQDYDEQFPSGRMVPSTSAGAAPAYPDVWAGVGWAGETYAYSKSAQVLRCPDDATLSIPGTPPLYAVSYSYNINVAGGTQGGGAALAALNAPAQHGSALGSEGQPCQRPLRHRTALLRHHLVLLRRRRAERAV